MRTKSGKRDLNPADAQRKLERKKEVQRNKLERKFMREAATQREKPEDIKKQLQEVLSHEEGGNVLSKQLRLRKKVLQEAYEHALRKTKEEEARKKAGDLPPTAPMRPEDSRYYHPTLNPTGAPPPGKAAAGVVAAPVGSMGPGSSRLAIPVPSKPPLPAGPAPLRHLPPPPAAPPLPAGPAPGAASGAVPTSAADGTSTAGAGLGPGPLPPPAGPPPSLPPGAVLPPPPGPPPGARLPPPPGPPPGFAVPPGALAARPPLGPLPPPAGPPPALPPPAMPPPFAMMHAGASTSGAAGAGPPGFPPPGMMGMRPPGMPLPPPGMPPPVLPPPAGPPPALPPPPAAAAAAAPAAAAVLPRKEATVTGTSTVVKRPMAQNDKALTSMVPASVRIRREEAKPKSRAQHKGIDVGPGFGLAPVSRPAVAPAPAAAPPSTDNKYLEFMQTMSELGAFE